MPSILTRRLPKSSEIPKQNLALWLRADRGIVLDTTSTLTVARWEDQSGNGRHATQLTKTKQPVLTNNVVNGRPAVSFNGTTTYLVTAAVSKIDCHLFVVFNKNEALFGNTSIGILTCRVTGVAPSNENHGVAGLANSNRIRDTDPNAGTSNYTIYIDGILGHSGTGFTYLDIGAPTAHHILYVAKNNAVVGTKNWCLGMNAFESGTNPTTILDGSIAEVIIYDSLTASGRDKVNNYLKTRYGI